MSKEEASKKSRVRTVLIGCTAGILALYVASYFYLARSPEGMLNKDHPGAGFVYVPWRYWSEQGDNARPRSIHQLLYLLYRPLNVVDAEVFGGPEAVPPRQLGR